MRENVREEAVRAMALPINNCGDSLATLWNAATYLVDRTGEGAKRDVRSGDALDSLLFGARAKRIEEIQTLIQVVMSDGSIQAMPASEAIAIGADSQMVGRKILEEMLEMS